jgi:YfiR/HmsC-like
MLRKNAILSLLVALTALAGSMTALAQPSLSEYKLKALFLYNFGKFVEWPTNDFPSANAPMIIGVYGENPFGNDLKDIVKGQTINGHPLVVRQIILLSDLKTCHILFISASETSDLYSIMRAVRGAAVLTVGETREFIPAGGMIAFFIEDDKIRFEINPKAVRKAGLTISSKLLSLSKTPPGTPRQK